MIASNPSFDAHNKRKAKQLIHLVEIGGYNRAFITSQPLAVGQFSWIKKLGTLSQRADLLEGKSTVPGVDMTVLDRVNLLTADFPATTFEGRAATIKTGIDGMALSDFITLATLLVDSVDSDESNTCYTFHLVGDERLIKKTIYRTADDGLGTGDEHRKTVTGNPMDILTDVLQNQVGLPGSKINATAIANYKATVFAGAQMQFSLSKAPEAKQFLDLEIFKALGGFNFSDSLGRYTPLFLIRNAVPVPVLTLTDKNLVTLPVPKQSTFINEFVYRFDSDGSKFGSELTVVNAASAAKYGLSGMHVIESRGQQGLRGAWPFGRILANAIFLQYAFKPLTLEVTAFWDAALVELGDFVRVTHAKVPNREVGTMGITNRLFQLTARTLDFMAGTVSLTLLDANWLDLMAGYEIAPDSQVDWTSASDEEKATRMFVASATTGKYSDGAEGNKIF
jgi:hypothetical protein